MELDDKQFADAFTALGILYARSRSRALSGSKIIYPNDVLIYDVIADELYSAVDANLIPQEFSVLTPWKFPLAEKYANLGMNRIKLADLNPMEIARIWQSVGSNIPFPNNGPRLRLRVLDYPKESPIKPWFRILFEAEPDSNAVHINYNTSGINPKIKLPLRIGVLTGNQVERIKMDKSYFWHEKIISFIKIGRENDNCDILLFEGNLIQLLSEIKELPVRMKCNMLIISMPDEDDISTFSHLLDAISSLIRCSGFVFINDSMEGDKFNVALNNLLENLSHNFPMDISINESFSKHASADFDPLIILNNDLAEFRLEKLVDEMIYDLKKMPRKAKIVLPSDITNHFNFDLPEYPIEVGDLAEIISRNKDEMIYKSEEGPATGCSKIKMSMRDTEMPKMAEKKQLKRFIQAKTFIRQSNKFEIEKRAFIVGIPAQVRIRIGPPDAGWESLEKEFPVEKLPKQPHAWNLTVVLSEPTHIKEPIRKNIKLPKTGPSTECDFLFTPEEIISFEGRIIILHRGRVIQTAVLKIPVVEDEQKMQNKEQLCLTDQISVRANIGDLEGRRQFDMAIVTNHTSDQRPHLTAIAKDHAELVNLDDCKAVTEEINTALSEVAKSVADYKEGLDSEKGQELLMKLALYGRDLYDNIVEAGLKRIYSNRDFTQEDYLQIVSTKNDDMLIPLEFIYEKEAPDDDARLCKSWKDALSKGTCPENCNKNGRKTICPLGFWGLSKVIERHNMTPEFSNSNPDFMLQSEPTTNRPSVKLSGIGLAAASDKVSDEQLNVFLTEFTEALGTPPVKADSWEHWESLVNDHKPHLLIALPHSDGDGAMATLEINKKTIKRAQIRKTHIRPKESDYYPIVALLGCDTSGTAMKYGSFVQRFRLRGASVVIGTIATVFGGHAAKVASMLLKGLTTENPEIERLGEVMLSVKRKAVLDGLLMALCVVAYGDADWKLNKKEV